MEERLCTRTFVHLIAQRSDRETRESLSAVLSAGHRNKRLRHEFPRLDLRYSNPSEPIVA